MKTRVLLLGCMLLAVAVSQAQTSSKRELWVWKDANGVTHYSDVPAPGAKRMEVAGSTPIPPAPAPATQPPPATPAKPAQPADVQYTLLEIWQPTDGQNFFGPDVSVDVRIRSEPQVSGTDRLLTFLDGKLIEGQENASEHVLSGLDRGVHSLTATIVDKMGNEKIRSAPKVFNIRVNTTNNPRNVGPTLKPHPAPTPAPTPKPPTSPK